MCIALPGRVLAVADGMATVQMRGRSVRAATVLYPDARPGSWVLVATGLVTGRVSAREAREIEALYHGAVDAAGPEGRERP